VPSPRKAEDSHAVLVRWMGIVDANSAGSVHGGTVMKLCDEVAGLAAVRHSRCRVVTAGMDRMTFLHPIFVGMIVSVRGMVNAAWRTSMEVGVRVEAENVHTGEVMHTSTAYLTMVALTPEGKPAPVPPVDPQTEDERRRLREAEHRRATRLREREEIVAARSSE
jgi:acyl-CoA hydrolase